MGDAYVVLASEHATATITVLLSFNQNPTTFADWRNSTTGQPQPPLRDFFKTTESSICIGVNIQSLNYTGAKDGANATILVQYSGGDGDLYQVSLTWSTRRIRSNNPAVHGRDPFEQLHDPLKRHLLEQDCHPIHRVVYYDRPRLVKYGHGVQHDNYRRPDVGTAPYFWRSRIRLVKCNYVLFHDEWRSDGCPRPSFH